MLAATSVAVVGASPRPGSVGSHVMDQLIRGGFPGAIYPINPGYPEIAGLRTRESLAQLDSAPDLVVLAVADHRLEEQLALAIFGAARSVVIFSPAHGSAADGTPLRRRLAIMAGEASIPVCGANGMGFLNLDQSLRVCGFYQPFDLEPGPVTFLSHSGSLFSAMLHNHRQLRFNLVASTGQELVTTMDDYLSFALGLGTTRVIAMFVETIRRPRSMAGALEQAASRDIPVVALKVGRSERGRQAAATHSGALAGEDGAYRAFLDAYGVRVVDGLGELVDTVELFTCRRPPRPGGLGSVHDSGGERTLLLDLAETIAVPIADVSPQTRQRLAAVLDHGLEPENPVDAWSTGHRAEEIFTESLRALASDPAVGLVAFAVDLTAEESPEGGYVKLLVGLEKEIDIPLAVLANLASGLDPLQARALRAEGIPVLEGIESGLRAIGHVLARVHYQPRGPIGVEIPETVSVRWKSRLTNSDRLLEAEALELLADYGIPTIPSIWVESLADALGAFSRLPGPVALKTAAGHPHKSDVGGVRLALTQPDQLEAAYRDLAERLGPEMIVQSMAPPGVELALGVVNDPTFGPLVMLGAGGSLVELLADRVFALPPFDRPTAARLLTHLKVNRLLEGFRGAPPANREAVVEVLVRLGLLAAQLGNDLRELDINPLIAGPDGAVAVDALVVP
ncbi:MAG TPA: acetate--CoA ligase family protein [Acidimicrobiia bacterium]|nr:acetate--CoA ligase family protein [Acidimicrobiia bacterium]